MPESVELARVCECADVLCMSSPVARKSATLDARVRMDRGEWQ